MERDLRRIQGAPTASQASDVGPVTFFGTDGGGEGGFTGGGMHSDAGRSFGEPLSRDFAAARCLYTRLINVERDGCSCRGLPTAAAERSFVQL